MLVASITARRMSWRARTHRHTKYTSNYSARKLNAEANTNGQTGQPRSKPPTLPLTGTGCALRLVLTRVSDCAGLRVCGRGVLVNGWVTPLGRVVVGSETVGEGRAAALLSTCMLSFNPPTLFLRWGKMMPSSFFVAVKTWTFASFYP